jgi:hypothetical protein
MSAKRRLIGLSCYPASRSLAFAARAARFAVCDKKFPVPLPGNSSNKPRCSRGLNAGEGERERNSLYFPGYQGMSLSGDTFAAVSQHSHHKYLIFLCPWRDRRIPRQFPPLFARQFPLETISRRVLWHAGAKISRGAFGGQHFLEDGRPKTRVAASSARRRRCGSAPWRPMRTA